MMTEAQLKERLKKALTENENSKQEVSQPVKSNPQPIIVLQKTINNIIPHRAPKKPKGLKRFLGSLALLIFIIAVSYSLANDYTPAVTEPSIIATLSEEPMGIIVSPESGSSVDRHLQLVGETKNIPPDRKIVFAVDVERLGFAGPKSHLLNPTQSFKLILMRVA